MRLIKRILGILVVLVIALVAISFVLPREVAVSRSVEIAAAPAAVFPHVNSLQKFSEWSPWSKIDPDMQVTYTGPEMGVGNKMEWTSEHPNVGNGAQVITASVENESVATELDFGPMGTADAQFLLAAKGEGTEVTWGFTTDLGMNPIARWMGLMMDDWIGADYERGLTALKEIAEAG